MATEIVRPDANNTIVGAIQLVPGTGELAYQDVNEAVSDGDATYLFVANAGNSYHVADFSANNPVIQAGIINSVIVHAIFKEISGWCFYRISCGTISGTSSAPLGSFNDPGVWRERTKTFTTDPNTGVAWTWAAINDLLIGVHIQAFGVSKENRCTQIWAVIDRTPAVGFSKAYIIG